MTGIAARSGSFRIPLQISRPSESGSMISSRIRSGRTCRHSSMAPLPVCSPIKRNPPSPGCTSTEKRGPRRLQSVGFSSWRQGNHTAGHVTERLRRSEFGIKRVLPQRRLIHRKCERERRPLVNAAFHSHGPVVRRHQVLDDREPQPGAAQFARARLIHAIKAFEQARQVFRGNPDSGVAHEQLHHRAPRLRALP